MRRELSRRRSDRTASLSVLSAFWRQLAVGLGLMLFLNLSGINVVILYSASIFQLSRVSVDPNAVAVFVGFTLLIACFVSLFVVARCSRKAVMIISLIVMAICQVRMIRSWFHVQIYHCAPFAGSSWVVPVQQRQQRDCGRPRDNFPQGGKLFCRQFHLTHR